MEAKGMKQKMANTLKWSAIDKVATQVLYAVTGIILAAILPKEDFGLVAAVVIFQSVALLLTDSGFGSALLQRKEPQPSDYSTVFWFNMGISICLYFILFACAPLIADIFGGQKEIIPLSRVLLLNVPLSALSIIPVNLFYKHMNLRPVAAATAISLSAGAVAGIWLALTGWGAWAIVWQNLAMGITKAATVWIASRWRPSFNYSWKVLRSYFRVGSATMIAAALNTLFQNLCGLFIGNRIGLVPLGCYSQADKWSKMGVSSISQVLNSSLPMLSAYQDDPSKMASATAKLNRLSAYLTFPALGFIGVMAPAIFHALFGTKWDDAIPLFQILLLRGAFLIFTALYSNILLARAQTKHMVGIEFLRDSLALILIFACLPILDWSAPEHPLLGLEIMLWGQVAAYALAWVVAITMAAKASWRRWPQLLADAAPYLAICVAAAIPMLTLELVISNPWVLAFAQFAAGVFTYTAICSLLGSEMQKEAFQYIFKKRKTVS